MCFDRVYGPEVDMWHRSVHDASEGEVLAHWTVKSKGRGSRRIKADSIKTNAPTAMETGCTTWQGEQRRVYDHQSGLLTWGLSHSQGHFESALHAAYKSVQRQTPSMSRDGSDLSLDLTTEFDHAEQNGWSTPWNDFDMP